MRARNEKGPASSDSRFTLLAAGETSILLQLARSRHAGRGGGRGWGFVRGSANKFCISRNRDEHGSQHSVSRGFQRLSYV